MDDEINGEVALAVTRRAGKYLILKRSQENSSTGKWAFPRGKIENKETAGETCLRELEEETNLGGKIQKTGDSNIGKGELGLWKIHPFLVKASEGNVSLDHKHSEFK